MSRLYLASALIAGAALVQMAAGTASAQQGPAPSPPPGGGMPPYQMRDVGPSGDRLASGRDGAALFSHVCGACHLTLGMGTNLLTKQRVAMGETPDKGLLTHRDDLTAEYVIAIARMGKGAMPPQTRVDVTDAELKAIAAYLGKGK